MSTGSPAFSTAAISQSTYSSFVALQPSGTGELNPGRSTAVTSSRES
jgi:hypothetical protein